MPRIHTKPNPGGYVNIKLGGIFLNGTDAVTVDGIHAKVVEAMKTGKLICVSDFYTDPAVTSAPSSPVIMTEMDDEGSFAGYISIKPDGFNYLYISIDDTVTVGFASFNSHMIP